MRFDTHRERRHWRSFFACCAGVASDYFRLAAIAFFGTALCVGCAQLPERRPQPASAAAPDTKSLAKAVDIVGAKGRLSRAERERVLRGVTAKGDAELLQRHLAVMAAQGDVDLYTGNQVSLLIDGPATYAAMFAALEQAKSAIFLESYIIEDSTVADRLAALLIRKRNQGVPVSVIYDDIGSTGASDQYFEGLKAGGVGVCVFNPVNPLRRPGYWGINHRDHRKILVVDNQIGFTGGVNISGVYSAGSFSARRRNVASTKEGWRDTQIQIRGPAVPALDKLFRETWQRQGCEPKMLPMEPSAPSAVAAGDKVVRIIGSSPDDNAAGESPIYGTLLSAIDAAERNVHFTMAYFAPGADMVQALCDAAQRGVQVVLVLPSVSDFSLILEAGRSYYGQLIGCGVEVHELKDALLHAKTAVIDGVVSTVGSSNLDWRSFVANDEVNAIVIGEDFGAQMEAMFQRDLQESQRVTLDAWNARPVTRRMKEWLGRAFERLL